MNHDGVLTYAEFDSFVKSQNDLADFSRQDVSAVFNSLDKTIRGKVQDTTISEHGALNQTEQANLDANIELYGRIYEILDANYRHVQGYVEANINAGLGLTKDGILQAAFELIMQNTSIQNAQNLTNNDAAAFLKKAVVIKVRDYLCDSKSSLLNDLSSSYPGLKNDPDLNNLIDRYLNTINANTNLWGDNSQGILPIFSELNGIIEKYLQSAKYCTSDYNGAYQSNVYARLNTLQIARLSSKYETALCDIENALLDDYIDSEGNHHHGYLYEYAAILNGNNAYLNNLILQFLESKQALWATKSQGDFESLFSISESGIQTQFKNSDIFKHITLAEEIIDYNGHTNGNDAFSADDGARINDGVVQIKVNNNWVGGDDDFLTGIFNFLGLSKYGVDELNYTQESELESFSIFMASHYDRYVRAAMLDIMAHPEEYEIDLSDCSKKELQDAILEYISKHTVDVARDLGFSRTKTTKSVVYGAYKACQSAAAGGRHMSLDDAREIAKNAVNYIYQTYSNRSDIIGILTNLGIASAAAIDSKDARSLESAMKLLYYRLCNLKDLQSTTEVNGNDDPNGVGGDNPVDPTPTPVNPELDQYKPSCLNGTKLTLAHDRGIYSSDWVNYCYSTSDACLLGKIRSNVCGPLKNSYPGSECGYTQEEWNNASDTLQNYIQAVVLSFKSFKWDDDMSNGTVLNKYTSYEFRDEISGEMISSNGKSKICRQGDPPSETEMKEFMDGSSDTGIYIWCNHNWVPGVPNGFDIWVDGNLLWEKFKQFLHH